MVQAMSELIEAFAKDCARAGVAPTAALRAGGVHPTLWDKWKKGVSPTLKNYEAARRGLAEVVRLREAL